MKMISPHFRIGPSRETLPSLGSSPQSLALAVNARQDLALLGRGTYCINAKQVLEMDAGYCLWWCRLHTSLVNGWVEENCNLIGEGRFNFSMIAGVRTWGRYHALGSVAINHRVY
jgi:hypothetical protein